MKRHTAILLGTVAIAVLLAGCSSTGKKGADDTVIEDRGISSDEMNQIDSRATTSGVDDDQGLSASQLDDPSSPLAVRVVYFEYDSSNIAEEYRGVIEAHAAYLAGRSSVVITLEGHADERGSREYNLALGEQRAQAVRRQLVLLGAAASQIRTVSYGEERPQIEGHDEQSYAQNRRVEIVY